MSDLQHCVPGHCSDLWVFSPLSNKLGDLIDGILQSGTWRWCLVHFAFPQTITDLNCIVPAAVAAQDSG